MESESRSAIRKACADMRMRCCFRPLLIRIFLKIYYAPPGAAGEGSAEKMIWFRDALNARGVVCTIRTSRGEDIQAACGMLSTKRLLEKRH